MMRAIVIASTSFSRCSRPAASKRLRRKSPFDQCCRRWSNRQRRVAPQLWGAWNRVTRRISVFACWGVSSARPVNVGDLVEQREIVGAIDSTALELAVRSAKAELSRSQAQLANASATEERQRTLIATNTTSRETLDNAVQVRAGAEASVARAQANLTKAIEQLGYAQVKADFAGVVTAVAADVGQVVSPGQTVVTVARPDIREAVVDIGPDFPVPLRVGLPFTVSLQLLPCHSGWRPNS